MNAHTPIPPGSHEGRPALDTEVLAVQQSDLLRYLAGPTAEREIAGIAKALDRDPSNLRKTLERLAREELVTPAKPFHLGPAGEAMLPKLRVLAGESPLPAGQPVLTAAQVRYDPNNPRTILNEAADDALEENIARRGLKTPLLVRLDEDGQGGELTDGFRRLAAIRRLIDKGDPRWPAHKPVPYTADETTAKEEVLADALVTSILKEKLHPLDEAAAFARLENEYGWPVSRILEETGAERRYFEQRRDLMHLTEAQQARMRLDPDDDNYLSIKGARGLLQHLRTIAKAQQEHQVETLEPITAGLDLTEKLALALVEVAYAIEQKPGREAVELTGRPEGGGLATLYMRGHVSFTGGIGGGKVFASIPKTETAVAAWLQAQGFYDDPRGVAFRARAAVLGEAKAKELETWRVYATDELNTDPAIYRGRRFPNATHAGEAQIGRAHV